MPRAPFLPTDPGHVILEGGHAAVTLAKDVLFVPKDSSWVLPLSVVERLLSLLQALLVVSGFWTEGRKN